MSVRLEIFFSFRFMSGFHVTGERAELWTDKALTLDWHEATEPIVPATTIKGWLRDGAERALRSLSAPVCDASTVSTTCGRCPVCEVFGHPREKSLLRFSDARCRKTLRDVRTSVSLSRYRKTAYEERLFSTETAWYSTLEFKVQGIFSSDNKARRAAALLWLGAKMNYAIGSARSRGLGWVMLETFQARVNGQIVSVDVLAQELSALILDSGGSAS
ncbi:MAG: RAMP superfamily CRISPR-associated protein [Blastocatellia bacterium]|nr:RAMP superfamily CRISPR-associated protein [Blastocatellia bacterium]MDW8166902.1 RAMP superfamily CRISPR-associated protein [Acidobacteriota bacterium]